VVPGAILIAQDQRKLVRCRFELPLDRTSRKVHLKPIALDRLALDSGPDRRQLTFRVSLANQEKQTLSLDVQPPCLTDYEGQLRVDPSQLEVDETRHQQWVTQILNGGLRVG